MYLGTQLNKKIAERRRSQPLSCLLALFILRKVRCILALLEHVYFDLLVFSLDSFILWVSRSCKVLYLKVVKKYNADLCNLEAFCHLEQSGGDEKGLAFVLKRYIRVPTYLGSQKDDGFSAFTGDLQYLCIGASGYRYLKLAPCGLQRANSACACCILAA